MAAEYQQYEQRWKQGHLYLLDKLKHGDDAVAAALTTYTGTVNSNKQGRQWAQTLTWVENILFGLGRQYIDEILATRISRDSSGNLSLNENIRRRVPQPTNDLLARYIETNISILTENRPVPRVTPKSDSLEDRHEATLSELTTEYLWEELDLPEKHREIARLILYTGIAFLEVWYDPLMVRHMLTPEEIMEQTTPVGPGVTAPLPRKVMRIDPRTGAPVYTTGESYGDMAANVVSAFELYVPNDHEWKRGDIDSGWIMREFYTPVDSFKMRLQNPGVRGIVTKDNGYFPANIEKIQRSNVHNYPLWWWERLADIVEGPHSVPYMGSPDTYEDYTVVRVLDRKPNPDWPRGRTVITAGDVLVYDSPKRRGARVYDQRWPHRWHPYVRYRGEGMVGSIRGRALVTKLLPFIKRINSIDATAIMYRRTVPIAQWIMPAGSSPIDGLHSGEPAHIIKYDPNRTARMEPKPVFPPGYPPALLQERELMMAQMENVAGTELILKGERPTGTTSAAMLALLRNQALASRSPTLQAWDESLQMTASALLQETKKHIGEDESYRRRIMILARDKASRFSIDKFAGTMISDNVNVKIDTVSQALFSREARQERALEVLQYAPGLVQLPITLQAKLLEDLGWPDVMTPKGEDVGRARMLIQFAKNKRFDLAIPMPEDDPYTIHDMLVAEIKQESLYNLESDVVQHLYWLITYYRDQIQQIERAKLQMMMTMGGAPGAGPT